MCILGIPFYVIGLVFDPNWIENEWFLEELSGIFIWKIPIEELVWFFMTGLSFSAIWEMWWNVRFLKENQR